MAIFVCIWYVWFCMCSYVYASWSFLGQKNAKYKMCIPVCMLYIQEFQVVVIRRTHWNLFLVSLWCFLPVYCIIILCWQPWSIHRFIQAHTMQYIQYILMKIDTYTYIHINQCICVCIVCIFVILYVCIFVQKMLSIKCAYQYVCCTFKNFKWLLSGGPTETCFYYPSGVPCLCVA